jgi:phosphoglycolate phosphatase-like HAD superfamily hydrolase
MPPTTVFLDVNGVIVDADRLPQEYQRLMGEVLAPALGGAPEDWGRANAIVWPRVWALAQNDAWGDDPDERNRHLVTLNVRGMAEHLGIDPPDEDTCLRLDDDFTRHVLANGDFFFADSADVIRTLAARHQLHMAASYDSSAVEVMLEHLGVTEDVGIKFGWDLVGARKGSPDFYPRIFEATSTDPTDAVVVDDRTDMLTLAAGLGAATVLVQSDPAEADHPFDAVITDIGQLPAAIQAL